MSGMSINTSVPSIVAQHNYARAASAVNSSLQRLTTGSRMSRAADDPAGLITAEALNAQLASLDAESGANDRAEEIANVADGSLDQVSGLLDDANAAAVANANTAGMSQAERDANQMEIDSDLQSVNRIASTTTFNGQRVLDGTMSISAGGDSLAIPGASTSDLGQISVAGTPRDLSDVGSGGALQASNDPSGAAASIAVAIGQVATTRGQIGAFRADAIEPETRRYAVAIENTAAAKSEISDTDYAAESATLVRGRILLNSTMGAMSLANSNTGRVLALLG